MCGSPRPLLAWLGRVSETPRPQGAVGRAPRGVARIPRPSSCSVLHSLLLPHSIPRGPRPLTARPPLWTAAEAPRPPQQAAMAIPRRPCLDPSQAPGAAEGPSPAQQAPPPPAAPGPCGRRLVTWTPQSSPLLPSVFASQRTPSPSSQLPAHGRPPEARLQSHSRPLSCPQGLSSLRGPGPDPPPEARVFQPVWNAPEQSH